MQKKLNMRFIILIINILFFINLSAQEQNYPGVYEIQEICVCNTPYYFIIDTLEYGIEINISTNDFYDFQFYQGHHVFDTIRAKFIDDSAFEIPLQIFQNYDNSRLYISGNGMFRNDSIYIDYSSGSSDGILECKCKGIKSTKTGLLINENIHSNLFLYPNPTRDKLFIDVSNLFDLNEKVLINILNLKGELILSNYMKEQRIELLNVSNLLTGLYILNIYFEGKFKATGYFIKIN